MEQVIEKKKTGRPNKLNDTKNFDRLSWLKCHPEDAGIDAENMRARRRGYEDDDIRNLLSAICLRAVIDYKKLTNIPKYETKKQREFREKNLKELRQFFQGEIFQYFVGDMDVRDIVRIIASTPKGKIHSVWRFAENKQKPMKVD